MKRFLFRYSLNGLSLSLLLTGFFAFEARGEEAFRTWTNADGKTIEARLVDADEVNAQLEMQNRQTYPVPISSLSAADGEYIAEFRKRKMAEVAAAEAPKPAMEPVMAVPGKLIYEETFAELKDDWKKPHGDWQIVEDAGLKGAERAADNHGAVLKRALPIDNAVIEYEVMLNGATGTSFSMDDDVDHVCRVSISPTGFTVQKDDHDHEGPDQAEKFDSKTLEIPAGEWQTVHIEILGPEMVAQIGEEIGFGSNELVATTKTKWGFTVAGESVQFRNLRIWEALPHEEWEKTKRRLERRRDD